MIKAAELRIGNLVSDIYGVVEIESLNKEGYINEGGCDCDGLVCWDNDEIFGIPLTLEILEKTGFELTHEVNEHRSKGKYPNEPNVYLYNCFEIGVFESEMCVVATYDPDPYGYSDMWDYERVSQPIVFVHELQNLFYTLTKEELTIKL